MKFPLFLFALLALLAGACGPKEEAKPFPFLGEASSDSAGNSLPYQIPPFGFLNQDSAWVTDETVRGKIYIVDFFFTTCPDICPKMKKQMLRVYEKYEENDSLLLLSHSLFPQYDTVGLLREYARNLGISSRRWHMLTGDQDSIIAMANRYLVAAQKDAKAPGGVLHSGAFILLDGNRRLRGFYDGTSQEEVDMLIRDIPRLMNEPGAVF